MDLTFTAAEQAFRTEVSAFVEASLPADIRKRVLNGLHLGRDDQMRWHKVLAQHGWGAPTWPHEFGGTGWDVGRQYVFEEECAAWGAPGLLPFGLRLGGPVIMSFGNAP